jgi:hypothetical protein
MNLPARRFRPGKSDLLFLSPLAEATTGPSKRLGVNSGKPFLPAATFLVAVCAAVSSCSRPPAPGSTPAGIKRYAADSLKFRLDEALSSLDEGRARVAPPAGWTSTSETDGSLVICKPGGTVHDLPRIVVTAEPSPWPDVSDVSEQTAAQFAARVAQSLEGTKLAAPVRPVMLGPTACARYVQEQWGRPVVARHVLQTVVGGRLYTISQTVTRTEFREYRDAAYAVAAGMRFPALGMAAPAAVAPEPAR